MLGMLEQHIIPLLETLFSQMGYAGVAIAMAIESACIPLPSELIMPMAGWMVYRGTFDLAPVVLAGATGNLLGSAVAYWVGAAGGRPLLLRYGRFVLISRGDMALADRWFDRYGEAAVFFSRLLPVVRTFISFPAGVSVMNFPRFLLYTFLGSLPWSFALALAGKSLGDNWAQVRQVLSTADYPIAIALLLLAGLFIYRHVRKRPAPERPESP